MVNDHTRSAENWKCVWYLLRLYIYIYIRVYVDSHSLGQLALPSKRTASYLKVVKTRYRRTKDISDNMYVSDADGNTLTDYNTIILVWPTSWTPALGGLIVCE